MVNARFGCFPVRHECVSDDGAPRQRQVTLVDMQRGLSEVLQYVEDGGIVQIVRKGVLIGYAIPPRMGDQVWAAAAPQVGDWQTIGAPVKGVRRGRRKVGDCSMSGAEMRALARALYGPAWVAGTAKLIGISESAVVRWGEAERVERRTYVGLRRRAEEMGVDWRAVTG
jgi:antitoxin (DNA-binding transcriptional repressor) of toxin-antitoxin stability system